MRWGLKEMSLGSVVEVSWVEVEFGIFSCWGVGLCTYGRVRGELVTLLVWIFIEGGALFSLC
jgi:hypothetical protein